MVAEKSPLTVATGVAALRLVFIVAEKSPLTVATGVAAEAAVVTLVFIVAVRSPAVGALVRFVTVVIVPARDIGRARYSRWEGRGKEARWLRIRRHPGRDCRIKVGDYQFAD